MNIDPLTPWRLNIKGMGGASDGSIPSDGPHYLTFNAATDLWTRTTEGIIAYDYDIANLGGAGTGGPYRVNPVVVPFGADHATGGSFWELKEGPYPGYLVSFWSNSLGYGDITVTSDSAFNRGPGNTLFTLTSPAAHLCGASMNYNAAGEMHFTMLVDDPNIALVQPKLTHYSIDFYVGGAWVEAFAGLVWDFDATDTEVVFEGIDYLGLLNYILDERFDPKAPDKAAPTGSKYVDKTIADIVDGLLDYAIALPNSPVNFITVGDIAAMTEKVTIFSTMSRILPFITDMLNSHRAGTGKYTRIYVKKVADAYQFVVEDDPGVQQTGLPVAYGDLANGYRIIKFGKNWASRVSVLGRSRDGLQVTYEHNDSGVDQSVWGRISQDAQMIEPKAGFLGPKVKSNDTNDLKRRARQAALDASRLGQSVGVGFKLGSFAPEDDWALLDSLPIIINHGAVQTAEWASDVFGQDPSGDPSASKASYWTIVGYQWESYDDGHWMNTLLLFPSGGGDGPDTSHLLHLNGATVKKSDDGQTWADTSSLGSGAMQFRYLPTVGIYVAAGSSAAFWRSTTGEGGTWDLYNPWAGTDYCYALEEIPSLSRIVVGGNAGKFAYSDDAGLTWTSSTVTWFTGTGAQGITSLLYVPQWGKLLACGSKGKLAYSDDGGVTWHGYTSPFSGTYTLGNMVYAASLGLAVCVGEYGQAGWTDDGVTWHLGTTSNLHYFTRACWSPKLSLFVAAAWSGISGYISTSSDGKTWAEVATFTGGTGNNQSGITVVWDTAKKQFINANSRGRVRLSPDGTNWSTEYTTGSSATSDLLVKVTPPAITYPVTSAPVIPNPPVTIAPGPPPTDSSGGADVYVDSTSGVQYTRNDDTGTWDTVAGTGYASTGLDLAGGTLDMGGGTIGDIGALVGPTGSGHTAELDLGADYVWLNVWGTGGRRYGEGLDMEFGADHVGLLVEERDASTLELYPDYGDYDMVLLDGHDDADTKGWKTESADGTKSTYLSMLHMLKAGTADPSAGAGVASAIGSLYMRNNSGTGELWVKTAASDTAWTQVTLP